MDAVARRVVVFALAAALLGCSGGGGDDEVLEAFVVEPASIDFGRVTLGRSVRASITLRNVGPGLLPIAGFDVGRPLDREVALFGVPASLRAQQLADVEVVFTPLAIGARSGVVDFMLEDRVVSVPIAAVVVDPSLVATPPALDFGRVVVGEVATATVTLENRGDGAVKVSALTLEMGSSTEFVVALDTSKSLESGESFSFHVRYAPGAAGPDVGRVVVADDTDRPERVGISLRGEGIDDQIVASPMVLDFGGGLVGETRLVELELRNIGRIDHEILALEIIRDALGDFFVPPTAPPRPFVIPAGTIRRVAIAFRADEAGLVAATLLVRSTGLASPLSIELLGSATRSIVPTLAIPAEVAFGEVARSHETPRRVRIDNEGVFAFPTSGLPRIEPSDAPFRVEGWPSEDFAIEGESSHTFTVVAAPEVLGPVAGALVIDSALEGAPPVRIVLTATAGAPVPDLLVETSVLDFGAVERGRRAVQRVDVVSVGAVPVTVEALRIEGVGFRALDQGPVVLAPGARRALRVVYEDPLAAGTSTGALVLVTNDPEPASHRVSLAARAVSPSAPPAIAVRLTWTPADAELDLHVLRRSGALFDRPGDCCFCNPTPVWAGGREAPALRIESDDGVVGELVEIDSARSDPYPVAVHAARAATPVVAQIELVVRGVVRDVVQRTMTAERRWDVGVVRASGTASTYELDLSEVPLVVERRDRCF